MEEKIISHEPVSNRPHDIFSHYIEDIVYGANDGIVTTFAIVSGVHGATLSSLVIIVLGFVNLFADGVSMGASRFLSIRAGCSANGMNRGYLEPSYHGCCTFLAFLLFGLFPLLSFLLPNPYIRPFIGSCVLTGVALFLVGAMQTLISKKTWYFGGFEMLAVGGVVALIAYGVGIISKALLAIPHY